MVIAVSGHQLKVLFVVVVDLQAQELELGALLVLFSVLFDLQGQELGSFQCMTTLQQEPSLYTMTMAMAMAVVIAFDESVLSLYLMGFAESVLSLSLNGFFVEQVGLNCLGS